MSSADLPRAEGGAFSVTDGTFIEQLHAALAERKADGQGLALLVVHFGLVGRADAHYGYEIGDAVRARLIAMTCCVQVIFSGNSGATRWPVCWRRWPIRRWL